MLHVQWQKPHSKELPKVQKQDRGQGISASLLPNQDVNTALPVVNIYVNGTQCSVLIDTGC